MSRTHLLGLEGTNPLGFFAALGVQVVFAREDRQPRLWWSNDITPHAILDEEFTIDLIVDQALVAFAYWKDVPATNPRTRDGSRMSKGDELKLMPEDAEAYLGRAAQCDWSGGLATSLLAQGSLDNQGVAKPSDFYFTAGQQKFLDTVRKVLVAADRDQIKIGLEGPWRYEHNAPSLGWDVTDDRVYALMANDPSSGQEKKLTNPGPEALAVLGLSLYPVFAGRERTCTQGCSGKWKDGFFSWPLWSKPATPRVVKSLLAHAYDHMTSSSRQLWYGAWGVSKILRSPIRRSEQGGYGTFGPPAVTWQQLG